MLPNQNQTPNVMKFSQKENSFKFWQYFSKEKGILRQNIPFIFRFFWGHSHKFSHTHKKKKKGYENPVHFISLLVVLRLLCSFVPCVLMLLFALYFLWMGSHACLCFITTYTGFFFFEVWKEGKGRFITSTSQVEEKKDRNIKRASSWTKEVITIELA